MKFHRKITFYLNFKMMLPKTIFFAILLMGLQFVESKKKGDGGVSGKQNKLLGLPGAFDIPAENIGSDILPIDEISPGKKPHPNDQGPGEPGHHHPRPGGPHPGGPHQGGPHLGGPHPGKPHPGSADTQPALECPLDGSWVSENGLKIHIKEDAPQGFTVEFDGEFFKTTDDKGNGMIRGTRTKVTFTREGTFGFVVTFPAGHSSVWIGQCYSHRGELILETTALHRTPAEHEDSWQSIKLLSQTWAKEKQN